MNFDDLKAAVERVHIVCDDLYGRDGQPIDFVTYVALFEDHDYRQVARDTIGPYLVSTIWLGIDHSFGFGDRPVIFETLVFGPSSSADIDGERYCTEAEALRGHEQFVTIVRATWQPLPGEPEPGQEA